MAKPFKKFRVLVFDPDGEVEPLVTDILAETAYDVARPQSADSMIETFTYQFPFDAVVMNLNLRTSHFLDMIPVIKRISPKAEIFVLSRAADERLWLEALERGARDLLLMPPDRAVFRDEFLQALQGRTPGDEMLPADAA